LDIVQKIWAPLGKLFAPPGVPSWLRACSKPTLPLVAGLMRAYLESSQFQSISTLMYPWNYLRERRYCGGTCAYTLVWSVFLLNNIAGHSHRVGFIIIESSHCTCWVENLFCLCIVVGFDIKI